VGKTTRSIGRVNPGIRLQERQGVSGYRYVCPAFKTGPDGFHDWTVPIVDVNVVLIPGWDLMIEEEIATALAFHLHLNRGRSILVC